MTDKQNNVSTRFAYTILAWFAENGRQLPWRNTNDPYAIWLSEIILQQTRIVQGMDYWQRFMQRFPTVQQLAAASEDEVLKLWQGLGYYSRARNLLAAARQIVQHGAFPDTYEEIRKLKGVGPYTAAAIGSIAFHLPVAVVDGNVYRVLSRYFGISTPIDSAQGKKEFADLAQQLLPVNHASAYNQGMMDFGAIQCTPTAPQCLLCPLSSSCLALSEGTVAQLPVKQKTLKPVTQYLTYVYLRCGRQVAIRKRGKGDIWQGLFELYNASVHMEEKPASAAEVVEQLQLNPFAYQLKLVAQGVKHVLTHRVLLADCYLMELKQQPALPPDYVWVDEDNLESYGIPRLMEILIERCQLDIQLRDDRE